MIPQTESTHQKHWIYTAQALVDEKASKNRRLKSKIAQVIEQEKSAQPNLMIVNNESEMDVVKYYISSIRKYCQSLPINIFSTASQYLLRFYLKRSIYFNDPRVMIYSCLNLAMKVEEYHVNPVEFINKCKKHCSKDELIKSERDLLVLLKFNLHVFSPYDSVEALINFDRKCGMHKDTELLSKVREQSYQYVDKSFMTDAYFLYLPSRIGYAAYKHSFPQTSFKANERLESDANQINILLGAIKTRDKVVIKEIIKSVIKFNLMHPVIKEIIELDQIPAHKRMSEQQLPKKMKP
jgi:cyclin ccl1